MSLVCIYSYTYAYKPSASPQYFFSLSVGMDGYIRYFFFFFSLKMVMKMTNFDETFLTKQLLTCTSNLFFLVFFILFVY